MEESPYDTRISFSSAGRITSLRQDMHGGAFGDCAPDGISGSLKLYRESTIHSSVKLRSLLLPVIASGLLAACSAVGPVGNPSVPQPTKSVELDRYLGRWFELARYENSFETDCEGVTANYSLRDDRMVKVVNTSRKGGIDGSRQAIVGRAKIVPGSGNAKLKVSFFGPFYGDYWILDHAPDYSWSIVGEPSGRYLWILTRSAKPSEQTRKRLVTKAKALGYDVNLLRWTEH